MKNILIIGSNGYIGTRLSIELSKTYSVTGIDINDGIDLLSSNTMMIDYSNVDRELLSKFDAIVLLAGHSSVKMCEGSSIHSLKNNVENFIRILENIDDSQCFIYASSSSVYGCIGSKRAKEEEATFVPHNNYDLTKNIIDQYASMSGKNYYGLRFGTVNGFSPITRDDIMINAMTKNSLVEKRIKLFSGKTNRPILDIGDLCSAIAAVIEKNNPSISGVYNLCSFNSTSKEIAYEVSRITNSVVENVDQGNDTSLNRSVYDFSIDNTKFCETFEWRPIGSVESIVNGLINNIDNITFVNRNSPYEYA